MRSLIDISGSVRGGTAPILFLRQPEDACATLGRIGIWYYTGIWRRIENRPRVGARRPTCAVRVGRESVSIEQNPRSGPHLENKMMESTQLKRLELFRDRWSSFGSETGIILLSEKLSVQDLKGIEIFRGLDDRFLEQLTPDLTIAQWRANSILFEEGSYIDLAFLVLKGEVEVYLNRHQGERTVVQPIYANAQREDELEAGSDADDSIYTERSQKRVARREPSFLANVDFDLPTGDKLILGLGEIFGEIGALNGWPMSVTARTRSNCTLLQIRLPALRLLKRKSKSFKEQIDRVYRERSLLGHLRVAPLFRDVRTASWTIWQRVWISSQVNRMRSLPSRGNRQTLSTWSDQDSSKHPKKLELASELFPMSPRGASLVKSSFSSKIPGNGDLRSLLRDTESW